MLGDIDIILHIMYVCCSCCCHGEYTQPNEALSAVQTCTLIAATLRVELLAVFVLLICQSFFPALTHDFPSNVILHCFSEWHTCAF